jgi:hypothetical protein
MKKIFNHYYLLIINFLKYFNLILSLLKKSIKIVYLQKICYFLKNLIFNIMLFFLFIALIYYYQDYFYNNINTINISYVNEHYPSDIFNNKPYFPSYFVKYEFLYTNPTFKYLNCSMEQEMFVETENYFLLKQSYILSEMYRNNNEIINNLSNI